ALEQVRIVSDLDEALSDASAAAGATPLIVHTSARTRDGISFTQVRDRMGQPGAPPFLILLGTGFGLTPEVAQRADMLLEPIRGTGDYNHLSVRAAGAIILDRLRSS